MYAPRTVQTLAFLTLRLIDTYAAKITGNQTPPYSDDSLYSSEFKNLYVLFLTKWPGMSKAFLHFQEREANWKRIMAESIQM